MINESDRELLKLLCSTANREDLVVFEEKHARIATKSYGISVTLSGKISEKPFAVSPETIRSIVTTMPSGDILSKVDGSKITFSAEKTKRIITVIESNESPYPKLGEIDDQIVIQNCNEFAKTIAFVSPFAHKDNTHAYGAVFLKFSDKSIEATAMDGTIGAYKRYEQLISFDDCNLMLSQEQCEIAIRVLSNDDIKIASITIDKSGKFSINTEIADITFMRLSVSFRDIIPLINSNCAIKTDDSKPDNSDSAEFNSNEIRKVLNHIISMFGRDDYPFANIRFSEGKLKIQSETFKNGYDGFATELNTNCTSNYTAQISPVVLDKCVRKFSGKIKILWKVGADATTAPITVANNSREITFFSPKTNVPRNDYDE